VTDSRDPCRLVVVLFKHLTGDLASTLNLFSMYVEVVE
jgi:hypothetical protein